MNLVVFVPEIEATPVGGVWRSMEVVCGAKSVEPEPLNFQLPVKGGGNRVSGGG